MVTKYFEMFFWGSEEVLLILCSDFNPFSCLHMTSEVQDTPEGHKTILQITIHVVESILIFRPKKNLKKKKIIK